jgi:dTDP-4-dehydrorhamnose reductase
MKKVIITGLNGTVAPYLKSLLLEKNIEVVKWDRNVVPTDNNDAIKNYIEEVNPDAIYHFAMGPSSWAGYMAKLAKERNMKFIYISTVSVYGENNSGPYTYDSEALADDDYGKYKYECEKAVLENNSDAYITRIGWQIAPTLVTTNNNMLAFLEKNYKENGVVEASSNWYPSTSFMNDTVKAIYDISTTMPSNLYLVNANKELNFYELCLFLKEKFNQDWNIKEVTEFTRNDIMLDERITVTLK